MREGPHKVGRRAVVTDRGRVDLDRTLLDSDVSEALAFEHALASAEIADPGRYLPAYALRWAG